MKKFAIILFLFAALIFTTTSTVNAAERLHVITTAGCSDAMILESDGHYALVDAMEGFNPPDGSDPRYPVRPGITVKPHLINSDRLIAYLKENDIRHLDFILATHAHSDHIGGIPEVLANVTVDRMYIKRYADENITDPNRLWDNQYRYDKAVEAAEAHGVTLIQDISPQDATFQLGNMHIRLFNYEYHYEADGKTPLKVTDDNYNSIMLLASGSGKRIFLGGDMENTWQQEDYYGPIIGPVDIMKLNHHGLSTSNSDAFLAQLQPKIAFATKRGPIDAHMKRTLDGLGTRLFTSGIQDRKALVFDLTGSEVREVSETPYGVRAQGGALYFYEWRGNLASPGWYLNDFKYLYIQDGGRVTTGFKKIDGKTYYFDEGGIMQTGWMKKDGAWYYLNNSGAMVTGWLQNNNHWYYMNSAGVMQTGWQYVGNRWYYLAGDGRMTVGWAYVNNHWYYMNNSGAMVTGWAYVNGNWYYMNNSGAMATGWVYVNGHWYYMKQSGAMASAQWVYVNGRWYYATASGAIVENSWVQLNGRWYYMDASGAMTTGWQNVGGRWYYMDASGAWVR
ncbi:MAG: MBL fold metallo-hydrolase [Eubacteriales bacterium]|nr:MBL fold metallo-hydrolase [Eubacteriales bacterium]